MSDTPVQPQGGLESQPPLPERQVHNFIHCTPTARLPECVHAQTASLDYALQCAYGDGFAAVHGQNHLPAVGVAPFLMAAFLADHDKSMAVQNPNDIFGAANWESFAHASATSTTLAPAGSGSGDGSNHSSRASFALRTASSSVSPAEAQPGSSGKTADQRLVSGSCSTTSRSFMAMRVAQRRPSRKASPHIPPVIVRLLDNGRVVWRPDGTQSELTALPKSLVQEKKGSP